MKKRVVIALVLSLFSFCLYSQGSKSDKKITPITGFSIDIDKITFTVLNTGYTNKSSFKLEITKKNNAYEIALIRIKDDYGKMMPEPIQIVFTQEELKDRIDLWQTVYLLNSFSIYNF
ncbi:MAG TPA: hypothetical protein DHW82_06125 [Spirochaetia bacterium]|nr:MAG: hypothetical protein A2Y41_03020 [Spirochaetes bacterium GWB1_36_13]HCL56570.1 hypothetical protein [Spirochaetia bacterium]